MTRPRRPRTARGDDITDAEWAFLIDADKPEATPSEEWWALTGDVQVFREDRPTSRALWDAYGDDAVEQWVTSRPGSRPSLWWRFSAPEPERRRLGGTGTAAHECTASMLRLHLGVPVDWLSLDAWADSPDLGEHVVSLADPPRFESQASYLDRHGLLLPDERARLLPADFEAELIGVAAV